MDVTRIQQRILARVSVEDRGHETRCWISDRNASPKGYTRISVGRKTWFTHRLAYTVFVGPIPDDMVTDHLCRVHACCNPDHLEPVASRTNILRGVGVAATNASRSTCVNGHDLVGDNVYNPPKRPRSRLCRTCQKARKQAWRDRRSALRTAA